MKFVVIAICSIGMLYIIIKFVISSMQKSDIDIDYSVHMSMTKDNCNKWAYGTFDDFIKKYNEYEWTRNIDYPKSHFFKEYSTATIHSNIIKFDGVGMVLNKDSWIKFKKWEKENELPPVTKEIKHEW